MVSRARSECCADSAGSRLSTEAASKPLDASFEPEIAAALSDCVQRAEPCTAIGKAANCSGTSTRKSQQSRETQPRSSAFEKARCGTSSAIAYGNGSGELLAGTGIPETPLIEEAAMHRGPFGHAGRTHSAAGPCGRTEAIAAGGGEVGKRLDFLLQELNREDEHLLSKTSGIGEAGTGVTRAGARPSKRISRRSGNRL